MWPRVRVNSHELCFYLGDDVRAGAGRGGLGLGPLSVVRSRGLPNGGSADRHTRCACHQLFFIAEDCGFVLREEKKEKRRARRMKKLDASRLVPVVWLFIQDI